MEMTSLITQMPSDGWFEGLTSRPNGDVLVTRLDQPEIYTLDARDPNASPQLVYAFPKSVATGICTICPLVSAQEEYVVLSTNFDLMAAKADNFNLWRVLLSPGDGIPPKVTKIAHFAEAGLALTITAVSERTLLICDSTKHCIWRLDMRTGTYSVLMESDVFKAANADEFFGINRIATTDGYLWFTNCSTGVLGRIPIELADAEEAGIRTTGPVEVLTSETSHCDGLAVSPDGKAAYTASLTEGILWKVEIGEGGERTSVSVVLENLVNPTAVELVQEQGGNPSLYVVCSGEIEAAWKDGSDFEPAWRDVLGISTSITITVISEAADTVRCDYPRWTTSA